MFIMSISGFSFGPWWPQYELVRAPLLTAFSLGFHVYMRRILEKEVGDVNVFQY
jgi:hypothetical protein